MNDSPTWSARHVAEYAYCPRLFYYMEVEGVFLPSADTELGKETHRRVDRPSAEPDDDPERPQSVRSLALTSETLGVAATLDLAEIVGDTAIPVEYRKGRPRRVLPDVRDEDPDELDEPRFSLIEPWPTDRVQVGLQALLLKEAGYHVPKAVLYYAEERRRIEVPVDATLEDEALATLEAAKNAAQGPRPDPLLNDPKCVRCSLQPICLPDEIHHQRAEEPESAPSP